MDSQRLKARGMISDPGLRQMVGQRGVPKPRNASQAKLQEGVPMQLAKGGKVRGIQAMENKAMEMQEMKADKGQDKAMMARHNRLMHPGQKSKLCGGGKAKKMAEGGKVADAKREILKILGDPKDGKTGEWKKMSGSKIALLGSEPDKMRADKESRAKMAMGGAAKVRKKFPHPKAGKAAVYE